MILTVAELLGKFRDFEANMLQSINVNHGPTIGDMYEGLTTTILGRSLPAGEDLRVVSGFIYNNEEPDKLSREIDCMLVFGEGKEIPYTNKYQYNIRNVIAVIEVKKTLYSEQLKDAYENLLTVKELRDYNSFNFRLFDHAYKSITRSLLPNRSDVDQLPLWQQYIYHMLTIESLTPLRIIIGYDGFRNEHSFRNSFLSYLEANSGMAKSGYGPVSLPNLIICGNFSLIKVNGMPYSAPVKDEYWPIYASYSYNPMIILLELLWTRLSYYGKLSDTLWGDDLRFEVLKPLLVAKPRKFGAKVVWEYASVPLKRKQLQDTPRFTFYKPSQINKAQEIILEELAINGSADVNSSLLIEKSKEQGIALKRVIDSLVDLGLVCIEGNTIKMLVENFGIAYLPDGTIVAGDNTGARLEHWVKAQYAKQKYANLQLTLRVENFGTMFFNNVFKTEGKAQNT